MSASVFPRHVSGEVDAALGGARVILIHGTRQTGKTTVARQVCDRLEGTFATLDTPAPEQLRRPAHPVMLLPRFSGSSRDLEGGVSSVSTDCCQIRWLLLWMNVNASSKVIQSSSV